ncbi:Long-chain-fatty-acid--CoA ligase [Heracleum sosnowskyi]|uniref:Long-chain-fatty-acid--CoA ligase n=1 Tax=Heracleum sosnowskyi TaxID=360622 RepID=A0AAD8I2Z4_9APIA|nr:Long-chain-fatty-acid--CoA ligase [Heracleum sosnowskyi]
MAQNMFVVQVEEPKGAGGGRPSVGPVYRNVLAKDGFRPPAVGVESCWDMFRVSAEKYPDNKMLGQREIVKGEAGNYVWLTYKQVYNIVLQIGASIRVCGANQGARCGIFGPNCTKWVISMQACNAHGLYCVPLYDTLGSGAVEYIICHAEISIVFVEETKVSEVMRTFPSVSKHLKTLVSFGKITAEQKVMANSFGLAIYSWDEFLVLGIGNEFELPEKKKSDICTIMYTSGTTGDPKGVMITNESIICLISGVNHHLGSINAEFTERDVYLSYLPLAHIFDRVMEEQIISSGASIGFWQGNIKLLMNDVKALKPSIFCAVPRVLDKIYSGLVEKITSGGFIKKSLFNIAYSYKLQNMNKGYKHVEAAPIFDKIVFSKVKEGLGGNMRLILSGAAPLSTGVETFLRVVTCADVLQGYGLTETCGGSFVQQLHEVAMIGTVGPPLPSVDVCLESVPDMEYDALASIPRGEICIRGRTLFSGYYKRKDLTKEVMIDGWFHTGDIGEWQPDGSMKIIDRKKNIFKLSQGEYVSVENLENIYSLVSGIDAICIYGNSYESFLVAIANPNKESLELWARENGVAGDFKTICNNPQAIVYILGELTKIAKENKLKGFEIIKAVHLDPVPFDMERGLLTPTFKKKRAQFLKYYQNVIDDMYKGAK